MCIFFKCLFIIHSVWAKAETLMTAWISSRLEASSNTAPAPTEWPNNAILLVDQTSRLRGAGMPVNTALAEAGRRRLRPILMTTLTTMLALLPLALGVGEGADAQAPMARTVIGGLFVSTLVALILIPVLYSLFHRGHSFSNEANSKVLGWEWFWLINSEWLILFSAIKL